MIKMDVLVMSVDWMYRVFLALVFVPGCTILILGQMHVVATLRNLAALDSLAAAAFLALSSVAFLTRETFALAIIFCFTGEESSSGFSLIDFILMPMDSSCCCKFCHRFVSRPSVLDKLITKC